MSEHQNTDQNFILNKIKRQYNGYYVEIIRNEDNKFNFYITDSEKTVFIKENFENNEIELTSIKEKMEKNILKIEGEKNKTIKLTVTNSIIVELEKNVLFTFFLDKLNDEIEKKSKIMIFLIALFLFTILIL